MSAIHLHALLGVANFTKVVHLWATAYDSPGYDVDRGQPVDRQSSKQEDNRPTHCLEKSK
jgi:hypothetical protein